MHQGGDEAGSGGRVAGRALARRLTIAARGAARGRHGAPLIRTRTGWAFRRRRCAGACASLSLIPGASAGLGRRQLMGQSVHIKSGKGVSSRRVQLGRRSTGSTDADASASSGRTTEKDSDSSSRRFPSRKSAFDMPSLRRGSPRSTRRSATAAHHLDRRRRQGQPGRVRM